MESIDTRVKKLIVEHLGIDDGPPITDDDKFEDLGDSLDAIELTMVVEDAFGIAIADDEAEGLKTVRQLVDFVTARAGTATA